MGSAEQEPVITGVNPHVITDFGRPCVQMDFPPVHDRHVTPHVFVPIEMFPADVLGRIENGQVEAVLLDKPDGQSPWKIVDVRMRPEPTSSEAQPLV